MKKLLTLILSFCIMFTLIIPSQAKADSTKLKLNKSKATMEVDSTLKLKLGDLSGNKVKWSSNNKNVATVNKYGVVTAKKVGMVTITAINDNIKYKCRITVIDSNKPTPKKTSYADNIEILEEFNLSINNTNNIVFIVKNNNTVPVMIEIAVKLLNPNGTVAKQTGMYCEYLEQGNTIPIFVETDEVCNLYDYTILSSKSKSPYVPISSVNTDIKQLSNGIKINTTNNFDSIVMVQYYIFFKKDGIIVDYKYANGESPKIFIEQGCSNEIEVSSQKSFDDVIVYKNTIKL